MNVLFIWGTRDIKWSWNLWHQDKSEGREHEEKEKEVERKMMENLFVIVISSTVYDVILKEQNDKHVNETHQPPYLKRKFVRSAL